MPTSRLPATSAISFVLLLAVACGDMDMAGEDFAQEWEERRIFITNGKPYSGHPSVGYLSIGGAGLCTATLVGKQTVLTAAHCIHQGASHIFYIQGSSYPAKAVVQHSGWNSQQLSNDIGLIRLSGAPPVTPSIVSQQSPYPGLKLTLIGFGKTSSYTNDAGTKRIATNNVKQVTSTRFTFAGTGGSIGNTCKGDSGGPAFATLGGKEVQVGVTSAGATPCGTMGVDTRVDAYYNWLKNQSGGDLYTGTVQDKEPPKVAITSPVDQATVPAAATVLISASDNVGVTEVDLLLDGQTQGKLSKPPWTYNMIFTSGAHVLKAYAKDKAGNQNQHQVKVTMKPNTPPPPKGGYGESCTKADHCNSGMCATDTATDKMFCTIKCDPNNNKCPQGAECLKAGVNLMVCGPPFFPNNLNEYLLNGGCAVGKGGASLPGATLLLLLLFAARRRS